METERFLELVEQLTGTPIKEDESIPLLRDTLADDGRRIDCSQFNEMLLLVNKDRVEPPFFDFFFGEKPTIGGIEEGIEKFQKTAMLCFGNFIYAYRRLSRAKTMDVLHHELGEIAHDPKVILKKFQDRSGKLLEIDKIERHETYLVGYISSTAIAGNQKRYGKLIEILQSLSEGLTFEKLDAEIEKAADAQERKHIRTIVKVYRTRDPQISPASFLQKLRTDKLQLDERAKRLEEVRKQAIRNQDIYLTWDHMDIYFATSMRKQWEYEDVFDFISTLMKSPYLSDLHLRYFDPTQCFTENRVNKGLVEALMLKRAKCTVYSIQDTDTLGKDSELAATLAQGKPVIAYIPEIDLEKRTQQLGDLEPGALQERLRLVLHAEEGCFQDCDPATKEFFWKTSDELLQPPEKSTIESVARIVAAAEKRLYDKRAETLRSFHPLGIQVNLASGVANGILVVRTPEACAKLLRGILTNEMGFRLQQKPLMWVLEEEISGCSYRVVTKDKKLTNCFWNFYRAERREKEV